MTFPWLEYPRRREATTASLSKTLLYVPSPQKCCVYLGNTYVMILRFMISVTPSPKDRDLPVHLAGNFSPRKIKPSYYSYGHGVPVKFKD